MPQGRIRSRAQQGFLFAHKMPFAKRWAHNAGMGGSARHRKGSKASSRAFRAMPTRVGKPTRGKRR